jgi:hypothetical protein
MICAKEEVDKKGERPGIPHDRAILQTPPNSDIPPIHLIPPWMLSNLSTPLLGLGQY